MIRFCDKEVITMTLDEYKTLDKTQLAEYFMEEKSKECPILLYDDDAKYYGMISYESCLTDNALVKEYFVIGEKFWDEATKYFEKNPKEDMPVFNEKMEILGFCYCDTRPHLGVIRSLEVLEKMKNVPVALAECYGGIELICIWELNEIAWRVYQLFKKLGYTVCVIGEAWEWFSVATMEGYNSYSAHKKFHIYSEGKAYFRRRDYVLHGFDFLDTWVHRIKRVLYAQTIAELNKLGIEICKVMFPKVEEVGEVHFTKNELLNFMKPFNVKIPNQNKQIIERLLDYYGEDEYIEYQQNGWEAVSSNSWITVWNMGLIGQKVLKESFDKRIYLCGPCVVRSLDSLAQRSLAYRLQQLVYDLRYEVVVVECPNWEIVNIIDKLRNLPIREKDILIFFERKEVLDISDGFAIDLKSLYSRERTKTWFKDRDLRHINSEANKAVAKEIYDVYLKEKILHNAQNDSNSYIQKGEILSEELQQPILDYVNSLKEYSEPVFGRVKADKEKTKIGSIVMNCNPFTKGHQYLIEQAASKVDCLYIFVVQEDKSFFTFEDRFELVKNGTAHLSNVIVVPSGEWVLSYKTLPVYFAKEEQKTAKLDAAHDVEIFARYIAPKLGITCRFAGEEPLDMVTKQYNEQMASTLPEFGMEFIEISRKVTDSDQEVISASRVRKLMKEQKWEEIKILVPDTTYEYLIRKFQQ